MSYDTVLQALQSQLETEIANTLETEQPRNELIRVLAYISTILGGGGGGEGGTSQATIEAAIEAASNLASLSTLNQAEVKAAIETAVNIDGLEALLTALSGQLPSTLGTKVSAASISTVIASDQAPVQIKGETRRQTDGFTRPADTSTYAANDVISNSTSSTTVLTFSNVARANGGSGYVTNVRLVKSSAVLTNASFRLWLYKLAPASIPGDNSPFTLLFTNRFDRLGYVDLTCTSGGTGSDCAEAVATNVNLKFECESNSRALYGLLVPNLAYPPVSLEQFFVEITSECN